MTRAPIYLVSACTSGEEFLAAFRRYADKNGLFVPIGEPLQIGRRARFAVTLRDGGVMIEGHAEVISSARTASVLHGRVGMTLRFLEPDEASQTTLGELERARLAMKPAPPSIPPRPAEIPAEPRPVPPAVQGRIDAVNALAQCVAIGDPEPPPPPPIATPRARTRSMTPVSPSLTRSGPLTPTDSGLSVAPTSAGGARFGPPLTPTETGLGIAPRGPVMPRPSTAPLPAPASSPRATPQPDALRQRAGAASAAAPAVPSGPTSDTFVAVVPPAPPVPRATTLPGTAPPIAPSRTTTRPGAAPAPAPAPLPSPAPRPSAAPVDDPREAPISATLTAVPIPSATPGSAPTEVSGILVEPLPSSDPAIAIVATAPSDDASARTQVQGGAPSPESPESPGSPESPESPESIEPSPPIVAAPRSALLEIEIAEPTDISQGPPEPVTELSPRETKELPPPQTIELPAPDASESALDAGDSSLDAGEPSPADEPPRPRRTALGFAAVPPQVAETASSASEASTSAQVTAVIAAAREEATGSDGMMAGTPAIDVTAPTLPPEPRFQPTIDELTPSDAWTMPPHNAVWPGANAAVEGRPTTDPEPPRETVSMRTPRGAAPGSLREVRPDGPPTSEPPLPSDTLPPANTLPPRAPDSVLLQPPILPSVLASSPGGATAALPSGDWLIARDPNAPDGWSAPFQTLTPPPYADGRAMAVMPVAANAPALDSQPPGHTLRGNEIAVEPKVQIDPTLIEPIPVQPVAMQPVPAPPIAPQTMPGMAMVPDHRLRPMPSDGSQQAMPLENPFADSVVSSPGVAEYAAPPGAIEAPPVNMMMAVVQSSPFSRQQAQAAMQAGPATAYPGYQMPAMPAPDYHMAGPDYQMAAMMGGHDPRFGSDAALPVQTGQRRVIIVLVSALVAAVIGIAVLLALGDGRDANPASGADVQHRERSSTAPPKPPATAPTQPSSHPGPEPAAPATAPAPAAPRAAPDDPPVAAAAGRAVPTPRDPASPIAAPPAPGACFADVSSVPAGAEIVIDQTRVIGTTPQKVALPCGKPIDLVIRKAKLIAVTRTVTPTREGPRLRVALTKPIFLVKVSSTPAGATITLNGRSLGVTPTTVKVPAFESSALMIVKDGFATETETVAPRSNGLAVHADLKRIERGERKKPW